MIRGTSVAARVFARTPEPGACEEGEVAKEDRGFASMDRSKQREIASKGGMASHRRKQQQQQGGGGNEPGSEGGDPRDTGERGAAYDIPGQ